MFGSGRRSMILFTLKATVAVGLVSYFSADWLTNGFDRAGLQRVVAAENRVEPAITGSLAGFDLGSRIDPCTVGERR